MDVHAHQAIWSHIDDVLNNVNIPGVADPGTPGTADLDAARAHDNVVIQLKKLKQQQIDFDKQQLALNLRDEVKKLAPRRSEET